MAISTARFQGAIKGFAKAGKSPSLLARYGAPAISIAILAAALCELYTMDWHAVLAVVPANPWFWVIFAIFYLMPTVAEWCIYHQIWQIPRSAILAMVRKTVSNDLLIGYAGETYLYTWARREGRDPGAAFGAVKDVSILSAVVGNTATMGVAVLTAPFLVRLDLPMPLWAVALSLVTIMAPPLAALFGRKRLFHLPGALLARIAAIHTVRSVSGILLTAVLWHLALPEIALSWWVVLSALKLLLSRLPLASNKELVFAGTVSVLYGHHGDVPALMAMMAALTVAAHIAAGLIASAGGAIDALAEQAGLTRSLLSRPSRFVAIRSANPSAPAA